MYYRLKTAIQISEELLEALKNRKIHSKESYEDIIWDLIEDRLQLKDEVVNTIKQGLEEYYKGEFITTYEVFSENESD